MLNCSFNVSFVVGPSVEFNERISMWLKERRGRLTDLFVHGHRAIRLHYDRWLDRNPRGSFEKMLENHREIVAAVSRTINNFQPVLAFKSKKRPTIAINCFPCSPQQVVEFMSYWRNAKVIGVHFAHDPLNSDDQLWFDENEALCDMLRALVPRGIHYHVAQRAADRSKDEKVVSLIEENALAVA